MGEAGPARMPRAGSADGASLMGIDEQWCGLGDWYVDLLPSKGQDRGEWYCT